MPKQCLIIRPVMDFAIPDEAVTFGQHLSGGNIKLLSQSLKFMIIILDNQWYNSYAKYYYFPLNSNVLDDLDNSASPRL